MWKYKTSKTTFDSLRFEQYVSKTTSLLELPPTSRSIYEQLKRCHHVIRVNMHLLGEPFDENPRHNGWEEIDGVLYPIKYRQTFPVSYTVRCGCKTKCSKRCKCYLVDTVCTEFCLCRKECNKL